ncbi:MAG TPA: serine protease, partial [Usitatibacter sp.]|nr:serine protease [Usitatibacter sp.]
RPASAGAVRIGAVLHFDAPIVAKEAGSCTLETMCAAEDPGLGPGVAAAIAEREKSVVRIQFIDNGSGFVCTATLIDTEKYPAPYLLTANHCVDNATAARTVTALWFYESDFACPGQGLAPTSNQSSGGTQLVFTNYNVDSTLLLMNDTPPPGAVYAGWNAAPLAPGDPVVSVSHPKGDTARYAAGLVSQRYRLDQWPQEFYGVSYTRGIIQGGSSGSGLFTMANGSLELRGILTGTTVRNSADGLSCTDLSEDGLYSRLEIFAPEMQPYISRVARAPDDAPNRPQDFAGIAVNAASGEILDSHPGTPLALDNRRIDYAGDLDVFRFELRTPAWVSLWSEGANLDTVGTLLDSRGVEIGVNDDAQTDSNHFGMTQRLLGGMYYLQVAHWDAGGTGSYNLRLRADALDTNYTDLWWNASESGWGINIDHQDNILFATLFTYDRDGTPTWLFMSRGDRQADGSYSGTLYRASGPAFDAAPFGAIQPVAVGTMRLAFSGHDNGTLTYTYNGATVTKSITRQPFAATPPDCKWSAFDRSFSDNFQDLWWNPAESGWGVNVTHHGDTLFATLFTYDRGGKPLWLVMSDGERTSGGGYAGTLYRTTGPAFDASPWRPVSLVPVGTMSFSFSSGNSGTLTYSVDGVTVTKAIQRQVFGGMRTDCGS